MDIKSSIPEVPGYHEAPEVVPGLAGGESTEQNK
jgi:hypothetical protein